MAVQPNSVDWMKDTIYRRAAIDAISRGCQEFRGIFAECEKNLNELPSAQSESCEYYALCRCGRDENKRKGL